MSQSAESPSPALSREFRFVRSPADFRDAEALVVRMPRGIRSKQKLLCVLADKLHFPRYFGHNWDALEECLHDLTWQPDRAIIIVHEDLPFGASSVNRRTYLDILRSAVGHHTNGSRALTVVLPADLQNEISAAANERH
jgi:RNAse (barnase) inhibitor barstar